MNSEERGLALACHISGLVAPIIGPLLIWLLKREESEYLDYHGREALNFQITISIMAFISFFLCFILIGFLLIFVVIIYSFVFSLIGAVKANEGVRYQYPLIFRFF